jgi:NAD-dependent deacetylase
VAFTGAGVSAASGVPTFRGADGLWRRHRPEDLATPEAFARNPRLVWEWYDWRRQQIAACAPNDAHRVLARWARTRALTLVTQNVDGLHERAGAPDVLRLHGSIWELRCAGGCTAGRRGWRDDSVALDLLPPRCPHCSGFARPAVVWFGEPLDPRLLAAAADAARSCEVLLAIGTSAVVYPAAGLVDEARRSGAAIIEINPDDTPMTGRVDVAVRQPAERFLPAVEAALGAPPS